MGWADRRIEFEFGWVGSEMGPKFNLLSVGWAASWV